MSSISIGKGLASTAASAWTRQVATLVLYMVAARVLTPDDIGIFALSAAIVLLFEYAVFDSISEAMVQRVDLREQHVGTALLLSAVLAAGVIGLSLVTSAWLARAFAMPELAGLVRGMAVGVAIICLSSVHAGILRRAARFHTISMLAAVAAIVATAVGAGLLIEGAGLWAMIAYFLTEKIILCIGTIWCARKQRIGAVSRAHLVDIVPYTAAISGQRMAFYARNQMDRLIIGMVWGAGVLGAYQIAARIFDSLNAALLAPISKLFFVSYTKLQNQPDSLRAMFTGSLQVVSLIAFPAFLGVSAVASEIIVLLFGKQWESSAIILEVLGFGGLALVLSVMCGAVLSAAGRARDFLFVEVVSTVAGLGLLIALSRFSLAWMAVAFVLRETLAVFIYVRMMRPLLDLRPGRFIACFAPCLIAALVMWVVVVSLNFDALVNLPVGLVLLVKIGVGAVSYAAVVLAIGRPLLARSVQLFVARAHPEGGSA